MRYGESLGIRSAGSPQWGDASRRRCALPESGTSGDHLSGGGENDWLSGNNGDDLLEGGDGDDVIEGGFGNDVMIAGLGNDQLYDQDGSDIYVFNRGDGQDQIWNIHNDYAFPGIINTDTIRLGVLAHEVALSRGGYEGGGLLINIVDTEDQIEVISWFNHQNNNGSLKLEFADGTVWDAAAIRSHTPPSLTTEDDDDIVGSPDADIAMGGEGDDSIRTWAGKDILDGGAGDDVLDGGSGADTYVFGYGYGTDAITENTYGNLGPIHVT